MSFNKKYDLIIVGGGMIGLTLASALENDFAIAVIESQSLTAEKYTKPSSRVSAINLASLHILQNLRVWPLIRSAHKAVLRKIIATDALGGAEIEFDSADIGKAQLGFIVENEEVQRALYEHLQTSSRVDFYDGVIPDSLTMDINAQQVTLKFNQQIISAQLIVGADGPNSWVRESLNFPIVKRSYHQDALIGMVQTEEPHQGTAYQSFLSSGPVALLPLHASHQSALIWSSDSSRAKDLYSMAPEIFNSNLAHAFDHKLGKIELISEKKIFPLWEHHAVNYVHERVALIGDAAHRIHPLAGQGANLGFMDAACLAQTLQEAKLKKMDCGHLKALRRFERWRKFDSKTMLITMRYFKELFAIQNPMVVTARSLGMNTTNRLGFLKKIMMNYATGLREDSPTLVCEKSAG